MTPSRHHPGTIVTPWHPDSPRRPRAATRRPPAAPPDWRCASVFRMWGAVHLIIVSRGREMTTKCATACVRSACAAGTSSFQAWFKRGRFWVTLWAGPGGPNSGRCPLAFRTSGGESRGRECYPGLNQASFHRKRHPPRTTQMQRPRREEIRGARGTGSFRCNAPCNESRFPMCLRIFALRRLYTIRFTGGGDTPRGEA